MLFRNLPAEFRTKMPNKQRYNIISFQFFGIVRFFSEHFFSSKGPPSISLILYNRLGVSKSQRVPLSIFRHCETFFERLFFLQRVPSSTATKMLTISEVSPLLARSGAPLGPFFWCFDFRVL